MTGTTSSSTRANVASALDLAPLDLRAIARAPRAELLTEDAIFQTLGKLDGRDAVIERMSTLVSRAVADPAVKEALERQGLTPQYTGADAMRTFVAADQKRWAEWVRLAKIPPQ